MPGLSVLDIEIDIEDGLANATFMVIMIRDLS